MAVNCNNVEQSDVTSQINCFSAFIRNIFLIINLLSSYYLKLKRRTDPIGAQAKAWKIQQPFPLASFSLPDDFNQPA